MSQYKVRNWSQYNKSLTNRGNIFLWVHENALKKWKEAKDPHFIGAPKQYSDDAILCMMAVKVVFHQPYRQLVGFFIGLFAFMGLELPLPHFTTVASRAKKLGKHFKKLSSSLPKHLVFDSSGFKIYGEGEWKVRQHGKQKRRRWKKLHIAICPESQKIILAEVTELEEADCTVMPRLLKRAPRSVDKIIGDGSFDTKNCYKAAYDTNMLLLTPPRKGAAAWDEKEAWAKMRNNFIKEISGLGGDQNAIQIWKMLHGYHKRSLVETAYSRFKGIFGDRLFSKSTDSQEIELLIKASVLNEMTRMGMPSGVTV